MADIVLMRGHKINKKRVVTTKRVSKWSEWLTSCKMASDALHLNPSRAVQKSYQSRDLQDLLDCPIKKIPPWAGVPSAWSPALIGGDFTNTAHCAATLYPFLHPSIPSPVTLQSLFSAPPLSLSDDVIIAALVTTI